jgi:hypothetical protein
LWNGDYGTQLLARFGNDAKRSFTWGGNPPESNFDNIYNAAERIVTGMAVRTSTEIYAFRDEITFLKDLLLLDDYLLKDNIYIEQNLGSSIAQKNLDKEFKPFLKKPYKIDYEYISFSPRQGTIQSRMLIKKKQDAIFTQHYGNGLVNAINILLFCRNSKNTVLLLEEPELHQHPFAVKNLIKAIIDIAFKNNIQLFITTHDADLVAEAVRQENGVKIFLLDNRNDDGNIAVTSFDRYSASLNISLGVDLRKYQLIPILVEGTSDSNILSEVIRKIYDKSPEEQSVQFVPAQNKEKCTRFVLHSHVMAGHPLIIVMPDYDDETKENITKNIESDIERTWQRKSSSINAESITYTINSKTIKVLIEPLGVNDDDELNSLKNGLKISNAVLEDSLFFILLKDEALREKINTTWKDKSEFIKDIKDFKFPDSKSSKISLKCYFEEFLDSRLFNAKIIGTDLIRLTSIDIVKDCFKQLITAIKNTTGV